MLQVRFDQYEFARYDFGRNIAFKIYDENSVAFNATGYDGVLKSFKRHGDRAFFFRDIAKALAVVGQVAQIIGDITVSWTTQSSGEGTFAWTDILRPSIIGVLWLEIQLTKSGEQTSTELIKTYVHPSEAS